MCTKAKTFIKCQLTSARHSDLERKKTILLFKYLCFLISSALMDLFEKRRFHNLLVWINDYNEKDSKTYRNILPNARMIDAFKKFDLSQDTIDFTGHALALYSDDE